MPPHLRTFLVYWLPLLMYVALIFTLSSFSRLPFSSSIGLPDKLLHFMEYALLAGLIARAVRSMPRPNSWWAILLTTFLAVAVLGMLDETYQSTVTGRDSDFYDWMADISGCLVGAACYLLAYRLLNSKQVPVS